MRSAALRAEYLSLELYHPEASGSCNGRMAAEVRIGEPRRSVRHASRQGFHAKAVLY